ncbi:TPA: MFS transporter [Candidatus Woesearchaeota archaeon]|nr:MFS transporter [Candidatus Woesearchaeota archaeon]
MGLGINRNILLLSLAFFFIFLGFSGVQQYVTSYFEDAGLSSVGFVSLILIYVFFTLTSLFSSMILVKIGSRLAMIIGALLYGSYIISLLYPRSWLVYVISALLGVAAGLLWTGQGTYLVRMSSSDSYGKNAGFFNLFFTLGSALSGFLVGFVAGKWSYQLCFLISALFPIVGFFLLTRLENVAIAESKDSFQLFVRSLTSGTAWRLGIAVFAFKLMWGLVIGSIPLLIKETFGLSWIGIITGIFFVVPLLSSYFFGLYADRTDKLRFVLLSFLLPIFGLWCLMYALTGFLLIVGILFLALQAAILNPLRQAMLGDITTDKTLEVLTALFFTLENLGIVTAFVLSLFFSGQFLFVVSLGVVLLSIFVMASVYWKGSAVVKERLNKELLTY